MALSIDLPDSQLQELRALAERLGVAPEALARAVVADQIGAAREDFDDVAARVLSKNRELYQRLS
jgi:hypothetical protein